MSCTESAVGNCEGRQVRLSGSSFDCDSACDTKSEDGKTATSSIHTPLGKNESPVQYTPYVLQYQGLQAAKLWIKHLALKQPTHAKALCIPYAYQNPKQFSNPPRHIVTIALPRVHYRRQNRPRHPRNPQVNAVLEQQQMMSPEKLTRSMA